MNLISEALDLLRLDLTECQESTVYRPIETSAYLRHLSLTVEALEKKFDIAAVPKPQLDPEAVWAKWRDANYDLDKLDNRERRTLCISPTTAMRPRLVQCLSNSPDTLARLTTFNGFVHAYFSTWRIMEKPEDAEALILKMLRHGQMHRKSRVLETWKRSPFLFSSQASLQLAEVIIRDRKSVKQVCVDFYIDSLTALIAETRKRAAISAVINLIGKGASIGEEQAVNQLNWIVEDLLGPDLHPATYREAMGELIISRLPEQMAAFQKMLVEVIHRDDRLGDPRLAGNAPGWRTMAAVAKERFLAWLAKETLQFFFDTLVPGNDENRRRAKFWLQYAKKQGNVRDFQVAVSDDDISKIKASRAKTIPSYSRVIGGKTSAFVMVFEGFGTEYVVIEFSETGNAAYIYTRKQFESGGIKLRSASFHLTDELKRMGDQVARIIHNGDWEPKSRRTLMELGIRP